MTVTTRQKLVIGLIVGLLVLGWISFWSRSTPAAGPHDEMSRQKDAIAALTAENARLKSDLRRRSEARSTAVEPGTPAPSSLTSRTGQDVITQLNALRDLKNRGIATTGIMFVDQQAKLGPAFADLFALSPGEQETLQHAVTAARDQLAEMEKSNTTVKVGENGEVTISVKPFPEGGAVYDRLMDEFASTLGEDRNQAFLALGEEQVSGVLERFGAQARTLVFSRETDASGKQTYRVKDDRKTPTFESSSGTQFPSREAISSYLGTLNSFFPANY